MFGIFGIFKLVWQVVIVAGGVLTYAEMRARIWPTNTAMLAAELDR
jgi:hypothetical protein